MSEDGTVWYLDASPTKIVGLTNIVQVASGNNYYYALDAKGNVYAWGYNAQGQLGQGHDNTVTGIVKVPVENVVEITNGEKNLLLTTQDGKVYSCGRNSNGQLGVQNYTEEITSPTEAVNINNNKLMSSGYYHSIISDKLGFVYTTGLNTSGQLGDGSLKNRNIYETIGDTFVYVNSQVVTVSKDSTFKLSASLNNEFNLIQDVIDEDNIEYKSLNEYVATVDSNGTITGKEYGKAEILVKHTETGKTAIVFVNVVPSGKIAVPEVENSYTHTAALKADGTVWTWGDNTYGQLGTGNKISKASPVEVVSLENVIDIAVGYYNTIAVKQDGTVWSFGHNSNGQLGNGSVSDRESPTQVLREDGEVLTDIVKVAGGNNKIVALDLDGNIWVWGYGYGSSARKIETVEKIIDISENYAVNQDGNVFKISDGSKLSISGIIRVSEGYNTYGQLGIGTTQNSDIPKLIKNENGTINLTNIKEFKAGQNFSMALSKDGITYTWGSNENYTLATTQTTNQVIPKANDKIKNALFIDAGINNGSIINEEGFVYSWGLGDYGTIGNRLYQTTSEPTLVGKDDVVLDNNNIVLQVGENEQILVKNKTFNVIQDVIENSKMKFISENTKIATVNDDG